MWKKLALALSGIRTVLLLSYFIIILLCITLVGSLSFYISYRSMSDKVETAGFQIVRQIENNMDNDFHAKRNLLLAPYYNQEYIDSINLYRTMGVQEKFVFRQRLTDLFLKSFNTTPVPGFVRFTAYYTTGEPLSSSDNSPADTPQQVQKSDWFRNTVARDGQVYFFNSASGARNPDPKDSYSTAILIRDFSNPVDFIIVRADYNAKLFESIGKNADLTPNSQFVVLDEGYHRVYSSDDERTNHVDESLLARMTGQSGRFWATVDGEEQLVSYTQSTYSNWKTVLLLPKGDIIGPLNRIKTATLYTAAIAFVLTFLMSILFGRSITKPILHLYKTVNNIKRGDFSIRADIKRSDEIGRIAANFDSMMDELQRLIENKYVYQIKLQEAQLAALHSQINPHFLYNTLDSIKAMADYHQVKEIGEMAHSLADMFRYHTKSSDEIVTLQEELVQIDAYLNIQRIRFDGKIDYQLRVEEDLYDFPLLKMTLQPLVENAVFHGIERKRGRGTIRLSVYREVSRVTIEVADDGVGISERKLEDIREKLRQPLYQGDYQASPSAGSIGIRNVYARYAISYGDRFEFSIDSRKGVGTAIRIRLEDERA